jgi:hypothetical protein
LSGKSGGLAPRTVVGWGLVLLAVFIAAAVSFDVWYISGHKLKAAEEAAIIAAFLGAVTTLAGSVSAIFAALSASKTAEIGRRTEEAAARATEALSRSMLPSDIETQIRVEPFAPRLLGQLQPGQLAGAACGPPRRRERDRTGAAP